MFKCSTWLCIAKLVRDHENRPWIWEGFAENRKHPKCLCWFNSWEGTGYQKHPSPAAICDWFRELVSWVVDNGRRQNFQEPCNGWTAWCGASLDLQEQWVDEEAGWCGPGSFLVDSLWELNSRTGEIWLTQSLILWYRWENEPSMGQVERVRLPEPLLCARHHGSYLPTHSCHAVWETSALHPETPLAKVQNLFLKRHVQSLCFVWLKGKRSIFCSWSHTHTLSLSLFVSPFLPLSLSPFLLIIKIQSLGDSVNHEENNYLRIQ